MRAAIGRGRYRNRLAAALLALSVAALGVLCVLPRSPARAATIPPMTWSAPVNIDPGASIMVIDCLSASLCVAADSSGNILTSTRPTGGSSAWQVTHTAAGLVDSISCPTAQFCAASDTSGHVLTSTDPTGGAAAWHLSSSGLASGSNMLLSCPTASFCLAAGGFGSNSLASSTDPGGGPSAWHPVNMGLLVANGAPSCPSSTLCVVPAIALGATGGVGLAVSTKPTGGAAAWHLVPAGTNGNQVEGVTCPSTSLCLAEDVSTSLVLSVLAGIISSTNPAGPASGWHEVSSPVGAQQPALSCAGTAACFLAGGGSSSVGGTLYTASSATPAGAASSWVRQVAPADLMGVTDLSCPAANLCVASVGGSGIVTGTGPATPPTSPSASVSPPASPRPSTTPSPGSTPPAPAPTPVPGNLPVTG